MTGKLDQYYEEIKKRKEKYNTELIMKLEQSNNTNALI